MMFYIVGSVWGIGQGAHIANLLAVFYDFCGPDQMALLFSLELMMEGIGGVVAAPLLGENFKLLLTHDCECTRQHDAIQVDKLTNGNLRFKRAFTKIINGIQV